MAEAPTPGGVDALRSRLEFESEGHDLVDVDTIVATIKSGAIDWQWNPIITALHERAKALVAGIRWRCTLPGLDVSEEQMTLKEARIAQRVARKPWLTLDPIADADSTIAVLTALYHTRHDMTLVDAAEKAEAMPQIEAATAFTQYTADRPFDGASSRPSTSATGNGSGRRRSPKTSSSGTSAAS